jgi:hypothetical protein
MAISAFVSSLFPNRPWSRNRLADLSAVRNCSPIRADVQIRRRESGSPQFSEFYARQTPERLPLTAMDASPKAERIDMYLLANHPSFDIAYQFVTLGQRQPDLLRSQIRDWSGDRANRMAHSFATVRCEFELGRPLHTGILVAALSSSLRPPPPLP